jgi:glycosyltransferase involved in cell wall biosynthesis/GT2 family glycosyltransferase
MRVSVVVCTYNRAEGLRATLESLRLQRYRDFEVIVVNGPSTDSTATTLKTYGRSIRVVDNPLANLSVSRNLGIRESAGEIVAFIDDDALPEPAWLEQAVPHFDDSEVAGVGGVVIDHTGMSLQYRYSASSRFGEGTFSMDQPYDALCVPGAAMFPYLQGTNALFRRDALAKIGLFDETFDFYLDETDVCCRLVDAGYLLRQLPDAAVHHKYLASARRNESRVVTNWWSIVRNHVYFGYRHGLLAASELDVIDHARQFIDSVVRDARHHEDAGTVPHGHTERARLTCDAAIVEGMRLGREHAMIEPESVVLDEIEFNQYLASAPSPSLRVALVSSGYTPHLTGGIARFISDVAPELARRGHEVRVFARARDVATVDLEGGVWVHRLLPAQTPGLVPEASRSIDSFATAVAHELERISAWWQPQVAYGSLWDVEMLGAAREDPALPIVPMLATPVAEVGQYEGWSDPDNPFNAEFRRLLLLEQEVVASAAIVHAISYAIVDTFERLYPGALNLDRVVVSQIGRADEVDGTTTPLATATSCVLFIGRLEPRKGIDVFLTAAHRLLAEHDTLRVIVAGEDSRPGPSGLRYPEWWTTLAGHGVDRLEFRGLVSDAELSDLIDEATVVVMPSRYESFGLVAVEAMMHGRPIVASDVGGLAEVIDDGNTGVLVPVDDSDALADAVTSLIVDPRLAASIAARGRQHFSEHLTAVAAAARLEVVLHEALSRVPQLSGVAAE